VNHRVPDPLEEINEIPEQSIPTTRLDDSAEAVTDDDLASVTEIPEQTIDVAENSAVTSKTVEDNEDSHNDDSKSDLQESDIRDLEQHERQGPVHNLRPKSPHQREMEEDPTIVHTVQHGHHSIFHKHEVRIVPHIVSKFYPHDETRSSVAVLSNVNSFSGSAEDESEYDGNARESEIDELPEMGTGAFAEDSEDNEAAGSDILHPTFGADAEYSEDSGVAESDILHPTFSQTVTAAEARAEEPNEIQEAPAVTRPNEAKPLEFTESGFAKTNWENPLLDDSRPPIKTAEANELRVGPQAVNSAQGEKVLAGTMTLDSGDFHINVNPISSPNFLEANRVQIGTARLGSRGEKEHGKVAKFRITFAAPFVHRPIVIVTTVPGVAEGADSVGAYPDVFAASVAEIKADSFVVNVVRVDSLPSNGWGQELFLDWIALEYASSDYPKGFMEASPR